ncbi:MotA/TolQ/ExbB proton channel family protein [Bombella sp. TMW 2.2559]|uniref:MotA/TolQ/ExbB proton channel family protein n=1 Tax=Bombella dulcis TaxID=2967339 RepID=A0ABT3WC35_9PROT|nr:MotA/TolQ/ExbB proton channel family protein [Bombella dulcis]MCX5616626.1 MotA/TolQ/ExbB proton channel family protein [Bombella dulcis]
MTRPTRYLVRIIVFLLIILGLAFSLRDVLVHAFMVNPGLDGVIIAILLLGILWNIHLTVRLFPEVRWVNILQQPRAGLKVPEPPRLLSPMARVLRARREQPARPAFSTQTTRAMLESLEARMDEGREISRYITQLLVFLGLLGTFYGLILTVRSVADVISAMPSGGSDLSAMFEHIKGGLVRPLGGMSTAFSASMFGLAGSLILGFIDLTAGQAQNRFANEIEEWLADQTFLDAPGGDAEQQAGSSARSQEESAAAMGAWLPRVQDFMRLTTENVALLQQNITMLRHIMETSEENNAKVILGLRALNENIHKLGGAAAHQGDTLLHRGQTAILGKLTEISDILHQNHATEPHLPVTAPREGQGSLIDKLTRISESLLHHREAASPAQDEELRKGQAAIIRKLTEIGEHLRTDESIIEEQAAVIDRLTEISENLRNRREDDAIHETQRATIINRLTEIGDHLRSHRETAPAPDLSYLQTVLQQLEEGSQATVKAMHSLSRSVSQRHFEDPAVTQLLQDMDRQLLGLRQDIVMLARGEQPAHSAPHKEG